MNDLIRAAAGRPTNRLYGFSPSAPASEERIGQIGAGVGGGAVPPRPRSVADEFNAALRAAAGVVRTKVTISDLLNL
jgi:hypothetical protein